MQIRAAIIDFDGTITTQDMSDVLADLVGKRAEGERLNKLFHEGKLDGLSGLVQRINFLKGVSVADLRAIVAQNDYLMPGAIELFEYLKSHGIVSIIASGNTIPLLEIYQRRLGADFLVGSRPKMTGDIIDHISVEDYSGHDFKARDSREVLARLGIPHDVVIAIGDSPADRGLFELAAKSIAINPKAGVELYADYIIRDDLAAVIPILQNLTASPYH